MVAVAGLRGTGDFGTDERPKNFREMILWLNPNGRAPLTALMARMRSESTDDPEYSWWEETLQLIRVQADAQATDEATTLSLESGGHFLVPGDVLLVETDETANYTNEIVEVTAVANDGEVSIKRGVAGTTGAVIPAETYLTKIGNAYAEGTRSPDVSSRNPEKLSNYCQIFKTAYELTRTTEETRFRTGNARDNDKKRKMFDHSVAMELAFMFGKPHETSDTSNGKPKRYTGGLRHFLNEHAKVYTSSPTEDEFLDDIYRVFDYEGEGRGAGDERIVFAGNGFLNSLNKMARDSNSTRVNFNGVVRTYGMALQEWVLPQGRLYVRTHPLMNTHGRYQNSAFIVDASGIIYRYLRDTKPQDNIQHNDEDTHKGQWLSECGIEVHHERTMAYLGNFVYNPA